MRVEASFKIVPGSGPFFAVVDSLTGRNVSEGEELRSQTEAIRFLEQYANERGLTLEAILSADGHIERWQASLPEVVFSLTMSRDLDDTLTGLARDLRSTKAEVVIKAIALLRVAVQAKKQGKAFGIAATPDDLTDEIVGF